MKHFVLLLACSAAALARPALVGSYGKLPLTFEENRGQWDASVCFVGHGPGYTVVLRDGESSILFGGAAWRMSFLGSAAISGKRRSLQTSHYLLGPASAWLRNVPSYHEVHYESVWQGVNLVFYGNPRHLEFDFVIAPEADPAVIRISFGTGVTIDKQGALIVGSGARTLRLEPPLAYQEHQGMRREIPSRYVLSNGAVGFEVGEYDRTRKLVIDPVLSYSTLLGGNETELGNAVAVDATGAVYLVGNTDSTNFPVTAGVYRGTASGQTDVFVTKLSPAGDAIVFSTYFGGSGNDRGRGIGVDNEGNIVITGETNSPDLPVTAGVPQNAFRGGFADAFVAKLNPSGSGLVYSTYLGGQGEDSAYGVRVDGVGNAYVVGATDSQGFPTTAGALRTTYAGGDLDVFVTKLNPSGTSLVYSTFLGGSGLDLTNAILAIDGAGSVYVTGETTSTNFPTSPDAYQRTFGGESDAFVSKLNPAGSALVYSTYLGGNSSDNGLGIAVDTAGAAYVSGTTFSRNFPVSGNAAQRLFGGGESDAFVVKLNPAGTALAYSSYLGGDANEDGWGIAVDSGGIAHVIGTTLSANFPVTADALQTTYGGGDGDVFYTRVNAAGNAFAYSTFLGWTGFDEGFAIALDAAGNAYLTGAIDPGFPVTPGAARAQHGGGDGDAFVAKISDSVTGISEVRINPGGVVNAANYTGNVVAPGEIVTIFGSNIGSPDLRTLKLTDRNFVDVNLGVTRVLFDDVPAPLVYVTQNQVSAVVPYEVAGRATTNMVIVNRGVRSAILTIPVAPAAPGLFTLNEQGTGQVAALNQDNSYNTPETPAARGSVVQIFATGGGQTIPAGITGSVPAAASRQEQDVTVTVGGQPASVLYAGNAPGLVSGVLQLNVHVPENAPAGAVPVMVTVGGRTSQAGATISVR